MGTKGRAATLRFGSDGVDEEDTTEEVNVGAEEIGEHARRDNVPVGGDMLKEVESEEALGKGFGMGDPRAIDLD